jgi:hypothetical protein
MGKVIWQMEISFRKFSDDDERSERRQTLL